jgi:hypothetical protein
LWSPIARPRVDSPELFPPARSKDLAEPGVERFQELWNPAEDPLDDEVQDVKKAAQQRSRFEQGAAVWVQQRFSRPTLLVGVEDPMQVARHLDHEIRVAPPCNMVSLAR